MKTRLVLLGFLVVLAPASASLSQAAGPAAGHYCLRTPIGGDFDEDELEALAFVPDEANADPKAKLGENEAGGPVRLGLLGVDLDIEVRGAQTFVGFSNYMPDNGQIVRAEPAPARLRDDGALEFAFTDNWRAPGRGVVTREGEAVVLEISRLAEADTFAGRYAARQFGEFKLRRGNCPAYR